MDSDLRRQLTSYSAQEMRQGRSASEIAIELQSNHRVSRATAWRIIKEARTTEPILEPGDTLQIAPVHVDIPDHTQIPPPVVEAEGPTAYAISVLNDIKKLRKDEMNEKKPDKRVVIAAAQMEINAIRAYAALIQNAREAGKDNVALHPQHARFRQELLEVIQGSELEPVILSLVRGLM